MEFTFEADPHLDIALGLETAGDVEVFESDAEEDGPEVWDLSEYNPNTATEAKPGSEDKVKMLSARYAAGVPLWDPQDRYDHGPDQLAAVLGNDDSVFADVDDAEEESKEA